MNTIEMVLSECGEEASARTGEMRRDLSLPKDWDHRLATRHDRLLDRLPRLRLTLVKVADAHASHYPELNRLLRVFTRFADELRSHMGAEERDLVPLVIRMGEGEDAADKLGREMRGLEADHARLAAALDEIACLTARFTCPRDACETYRMLMSELQDFAATLRGVIAEEDAVLFSQLVDRPSGWDREMAGKERWASTDASPHCDPDGSSHGGCRRTGATGIP